MNYQDLFMRRLPKYYLFWGIAIPYTKENFLRCCSLEKNSDFIEALKSQFKTTDPEVLWIYYEKTAKDIALTVNFLRKRGVNIVDLYSLKQLDDAFLYSTVIITAHRHRLLDCLEFMGYTISFDNLVMSIPETYKGMIDISSCYSTTFQMKCKLRAIHANIIAAETESSIKLRVFIYRETIRHLVTHTNGNYLKSLRVILRRIVLTYESSENAKADIFLGGRLNDMDISEAKGHVNEFYIKERSSINSYLPKNVGGKHKSLDKSFWYNLFKKVKRYKDVYCSIFAPSEVKRKSHLQVQVYLHLYEESEKVKSLAKESDKNAERKDYIPLSLKLKNGDKVDVEFYVYGETRLMSERKSIIWQGSFTKCSFDYFVPKDLDVDELSCVALLSVNGLPLGEMRFITNVVEAPRQLNPKIITHKYNKIFISYSHLDESKVKFLHEGLELSSVPHFFDRTYLEIGDVFPQKIKDYIESADLFILCWSQNASKSDYVQKECQQALERAFPKVQPENAAKLRIYPLSIEPRAELPSDMKEIYNFGVI